MFQINVYFSTERDTSVDPQEQAVSGKDFVAVQTTIDMLSGITTAAIEIPVLAVSTMTL